MYFAAAIKTGLIQICWTLNILSDNLLFSIFNLLKFFETDNFTLPVTREVYDCNLIVIFLWKVAL